MIFAIIGVVVVIAIIGGLVAAKGKAKSKAAEPTSWPHPETDRPGPTRFSDMKESSEARASDVAPVLPDPRPAAVPVAGPAPLPVLPSADVPAPTTAQASSSVAPTEVATPAVVDSDEEPAADASPTRAATESAPTSLEADAEALFDDDADLSRFGVETPRKASKPIEMPKAQVRHLEGGPAAATADAPTGEPRSQAEVDDEADAPSLDFGAATVEFDAPDQPDPDESPSVVEGTDAVVASDLPGIDADTVAAGLANLELDWDAFLVIETDPIELSDLPQVEADLDDLEPVEFQPEPASPAADVDRVIMALIDRARERDQSVVEVATELVERADQDDDEASRTLKTLFGTSPEGESVDISERLSELTLFNDAVPRKPGALTQFMDLDDLTRKRVIVRVLCLLVAKSVDDMKALPKNPASEAETRQWPLARAVWPVKSKEAPDVQDADLPARGLDIRG